LRLSAAIAAALCLCACPKDDAPSPDDRLLQKLKAEQERVAKGGNPGRSPVQPEDPNAHLANLAASDDKLKDRPLPSGNETVHVGTVALKLFGLKTGHAAASGKISLTTEDLFLRVELAAQNVGKANVTLDLDFAEVVAGERRFAVARDVQRAAGTRELRREFTPDDRVDVVLFFEVPREVFGQGLALSFPPSVGGAGDVKVPLE
jgi:hypothetical protein